MAQWGSALPNHLQTYPTTPAEAQFTSSSKIESARRVHFDIDNLIGSPFFLTTVSIALIGWLVAFFSSIVANANNHNFSHFAWWALMFQLCVLLGICTAILFDTSQRYRLAICAFLASALSFTTSTANALIYSSSGAQEAAAAGHIFLSIVNILWMLYFGSERDAALHTWVDGYALNKGPSVPAERSMSDTNALYPSGRYGTPYPKSVLDADAHTTTNIGMSPPPSHVNMAYATSKRETTETTTSVAPAESDYIYKAKAIYTYEANPEDPNEISFSKEESLDVADCSGRWYQVRNAKGEAGIAPSNYLSLIPPLKINLYVRIPRPYFQASIPAHVRYPEKHAR